MLATAALLLRSSLSPPPTAATLVMATGATTGCFVLASLLLRSLYKDHQLRGLPSPPSPSVFLGHILQTMGSIANWKTSGLYPEPFLSWVAQFGGAIHLREFWTHVVLVTDPKAVQYILTTHGGNYVRNPTVQAFFADITIGPGLMSVNGAAHDHFRKMLNPLFTANQTKAFVGMIERQAQRCVDTVLAPAYDTQTPVNLANVLHELSLEVIGLASFGLDFRAFPRVHDAYNQYTLRLNPLLMIGVLTIPGFLNLPLPSFERRRAAQRELKRIMTHVIDQKLSEAPAKDASVAEVDLLDLILPHASTHDEAIVHTMTIITAGHRTATATMSFVFAMLAQHPEVADTIREETAAALLQYGSLSHWETVASLPYTYAVLQESLRLHSTAVSLVRLLCQADDTIPLDDGSAFFVPQGTMVDINLAAMHRNPKYWTDPDAFKPERFVQGSSMWESDLARRGGKPHTFFFLPFGAGSRNCIGYRFAMAEMQITVATFLVAFDFQLAETADLRHCTNGVTLQPNNLEVVLKKRRRPVELPDAEMH
ncbi:Aste57867_12327 [Aphanomyces stellatus]|uniref:Aste57867_12327 protein n=1 Tax=Aphanomyces stellatus TaxID=120398 RepID=A0A485KV97_9STRA|nr:hypothetical protein As57867_012281 [Aphanomyces stellatus]VFT89179.1 Aste57867_12327 [Aphanomyces stellatus]